MHHIGALATQGRAPWLCTILVRAPSLPEWGCCFFATHPKQDSRGSGRGAPCQTTSLYNFLPLVFLVYRVLKFFYFSICQRGVQRRSQAKSVNLYTGCLFSSYKSTTYILSRVGRVYLLTFNFLIYKNKNKNNKQTQTLSTCDNLCIETNMSVESVSYSGVYREKCIEMKAKMYR